MDSYRTLNSGAHFVLIVAASAFLCGAAANRDLEAVRKKIAKEKEGLSELKVKEGSVLQSLGKIDRELGKRTSELRRTQNKLSLLGREMAAKKVEAKALDRSITLRQGLLQKRAVALYRWQRGGGALGLLGGANSTTALLQRRHYFRAVLAFDQHLLAEFQEQSRHQAVVRAELGQKKLQLDDQKQALGAAREAVRREAEKKKVVLASLRAERATRLQALQQMEAAALRLQKMLDQISRRAVVKPRRAPALPSIGTGLERLRGNLDWPVRGQVSSPFGKFKHPEFASEIVRKGIDIDAPLGAPIRAVEQGRIVFADRFTGYGEMVIIDHGERYYTVYGHLAKSLKKNGDEIRRGETLGRVGDGDSLGGSKLYFEMRKDGRSMDPLSWLKKP